MNYQYTIWHIDEKQRWICLKSNDERDFEEPDAFVFLVKAIQAEVNGSIKKAGPDQVAIEGDGIGLIYRWDDLFGITVIYPQNVSKETALRFLKPFTGEISMTGPA